MIQKYFLIFQKLDEMGNNRKREMIPVLVQLVEKKKAKSISISFKPPKIALYLLGLDKIS